MRALEELDLSSDQRVRIAGNLSFGLRGDVKVEGAGGFTIRSPVLHPAAAGCARTIAGWAEEAEEDASAYLRLAGVAVELGYEGAARPLGEKLTRIVDREPGLFRSFEFDRTFSEAVGALEHAGLAPDALPLSTLQRCVEVSTSNIALRSMEAIAAFADDEALEVLLQLHGLVNDASTRTSLEETHRRACRAAGSSYGSPPSAAAPRLMRNASHRSYVTRHIIGVYATRHGALLGEEEILERKSDRSEVRPAARVSLVALLALVISAFAVACGGEPQGGRGEAEPGGTTRAMSVPEETTAMEETTVETASAPAEATVGPQEQTNMLPADGKEPDPAQPLPENPPEGVVTFPASTNKTVEGEIEYAQSPPANGDHAPLWQNCGFYSQPINDVNAVHSMDHGVVWITYSPDLSQEGINALRPYGAEEYVIVSPYPGQDAPVIATAWRNQIELDGPDDPRLRQFVDGYRVSEIAPLSGNRCVGGVGEPEPIG